MQTQNKNTLYKGNVADFAETKGYFIGQFMGQKGKPELETEEVEIAWKKLAVSPIDEQPHFHRKGIEICIVISGGYSIEVNQKPVSLQKGDFLVVYPETVAKVISIEPETEVLVVKAPSVPDDKISV